MTAKREKQVLLTAGEMDQSLRRLAEGAAASHWDLKSLVIVGIRTGGAFLAYRLQNSSKT
jgi:pyrimidine operon attenuation protein/uracil phosphoribosyltransferase